MKNMEEVDIETLRICRQQLVADIHPESVCDGLFEKNVLSAELVAEINVLSTAYQRNRKLLEIIPMRGKEAFATFVSVLETTGHRHLADQLMAEKLGRPVRPNFQAQQQQESQSVNAGEWAIIAWFNSRLFIMPRVRNALKELYCKSFKLINPLSLDFTFDIEKTFVSLTFKTKNVLNCDDTENHTEMLNAAFTEHHQLLVIEGAAAMGKTTLMKRLAHEWARGKNKSINKYTFVFYVEFRRLQGRYYETIIDMAVEYLKEFCSFNGNDDLCWLINHKTINFRNVLILLDGYDEAVPSKPCLELNKYLDTSNSNRFLSYNVVISTRPGYLSHFDGQRGFCHFASIQGFVTQRQKELYIFAHFASDVLASTAEAGEQIKKILKANASLSKLAETPLFLTFICLVYEKMKTASEFDLYCCIIWWMLDRFQRKNPKHDVPALFEYNQHHDDMVELDVKYYIVIIQDHFLEFPLLHKLSKMAFECYETLVFDHSHLKHYEITDIACKIGLMVVEERRNPENHRLERFYSFPHKTIEEFLAGGIYYFPTLRIKADNDELVAEMSENDVRPIVKLEHFVWQATTIDKYTASLFFQKYKSKSMRAGEFTIFNQSGGNNLKRCVNLHTLDLVFEGDDFAMNVKLNDFPNLQNLTIRGDLSNAPIAIKATQVYNKSENYKRPLNVILEDCKFKSVGTVQNLFDYFLRRFHPTTIITLRNVNVVDDAGILDKIAMTMDSREIRSVMLADSNGDPFADQVELIKNMNQLKIIDGTDTSLRNLHLPSGIYFPNLKKLTLKNCVASVDSLAVFLSLCPCLQELKLHCISIVWSTTEFETTLATYPRALETTNIGKLTIVDPESFSTIYLTEFFLGIEKCTQIRWIRFIIGKPLVNAMRQKLPDDCWLVPEGSIVEQSLISLAINMPRLEEIKIVSLTMTTEERDSWETMISKINEAGKKRNRNFQCILFFKKRELTVGEIRRSIKRYQALKLISRWK